DRLVADAFTSLSGLSVGVLAHQPSVDRDLRHIVPLLLEAGVQVSALFGPEHGLDGAAQDMEDVPDGATPRDRRSGARIYSLYGSDEASLRPSSEMFEGLDVLLVDLQDVGARYYTYAATMGYALETAAEVGLRVIVLDRPNPLGGLGTHLEGPALETGFESFVGAFPMAIRHGLTLAEYAAWVRKRKGLDVDLEVVEMVGWSRDMDYEATGLPWVLPSPNMPTMEAAWIYPGQCLLEGTNLSEGRGTTRPFELCGAPWLDGAAWAEKARPDVGAGVELRPTAIKPMFQKHAGLSCGAVQIHTTNRWLVRSLRVTVALLAAARALAPNDFEWRTDAYEFVSDRLAIDLLFGSAKPREALEGGASVDDVMATFTADENAFREARRDVLIYPDA
ncbi:MAG: DUF1343 domain-containing protein, partial [Myxococcota bacterium]